MGVISNSLAEKAGLVPGDVLTQYDGKPLADNASLRKAVRNVTDAIEDGQRKSGDVMLDLWREGKLLALATGVTVIVEVSAPSRLERFSRVAVTLKRTEEGWRVLAIRVES